MANEMIWANNNGVLTNNKLNKDYRLSAQPLTRFRQFVSLKEAFGKGVGESANWDKIANVSTRGHQVAETSTMPETTQIITKGTVTVAEWGNAIPFSFKIETLSEIDVKDYINQGLRNDMVQSMDGAIERQYNSTPLRYVGSSTILGVLTTNGTATATNTSVLNAYHIRKMVLELEKRNVPGFPSLGGNYGAVLSLEAAESLAGALESVMQYTEKGMESNLNGEIGRYYGTRFVKDGFASRYTYNVTTGAATARSWTGSYSLTGYLFGDQTVREVIAHPEEIRMKVTTDYGRSKGLAWYFLGNWGIEWSDEPNARIICWDSA